MKKTYRPKPYRIALNIFYGLCAAFLLGFIANYWLEPLLAVGIGVIAFGLYFYLVIFDCLITVTIANGELTYQKRSKIKKFTIKDCRFHARSTTSMAETSCRLYVTSADNSVELIDCELIGIKDFQLMLEDLGITGKKAAPIKLKTKRKE